MNRKQRRLAERSRRKEADSRENPSQRDIPPDVIAVTEQGRRLYESGRKRASVDTSARSCRRSAM